MIEEPSCLGRRGHFAMHRGGQGFFLPHAKVKIKVESANAARVLFCITTTYMLINQNESI